MFGPRQNKPIGVEQIDTPPENLDELKKFLAKHRGANKSARQYMTRVVGRCWTCGCIPTKLVKFKVFGVLKIEKYCDECFAKSFPNLVNK